MATRADLAALIDSASGFHVVTDSEGVIVDVFGADVDALAARPGALRGRPLAQYVAPESRTAFAELLERSSSDPSSAELELRARRRAFAAMARAWKPAGTRHVCWAFARVARRDDAPASARGVELTGAEQLADVFERLQQGIVVVDRALRVTAANSAARRLLAVRLGVGDRLPAGGSFDLREIAARAFEGSAAPELEVSDGNKSYRIASIPPERPDDAAVLVITDRTEQERHERVERDFVAYASHELRTPLATISGAIEILQDGAKEIPDARDRFLRHIEREVTRLGRLVAALLVLARVQAGHELPEVGSVVVRPVLEEAAGRLHVAPSVDVVVACPARLSVVAHRDLLAEIVGNLGVNAAKFTDEGRIVFAALAYRDAVAIEVRDTGRGIPVEAQGLLFERFYRTDDRTSDGFGLGLSIVREAVTALGGCVEIESAPGRGTTVRVVLPLATTGDGA